MGKSDNNIADGAGLDLDKQNLLRQLKAGEKVLMRVQQERNKLQDAKTSVATCSNRVHTTMNSSWYSGRCSKN